MSDRYPDDWPERSREAKRSRQSKRHGNKVQCSCCGGWFDWDHIEVHHTSYRKDKDKVGVNIFPVCGSKQDKGTCHHWVHQPGNWIKDKHNPVWRNRNSSEVVSRLQRGYKTGDPNSKRIPWFGLITIAIAIGYGFVWLGPESKTPSSNLRNSTDAHPIGRR